MTNRLSRRMMLRGIGGATLAIPFLPSLVSRSHAAGPRCPKRFIFVYTANGQQPTNWYPQGPQPWSTVSASEFVRERSLVGQTGGLSTVLGSAFDPVMEKLLLLRGLDTVHFNRGSGHSPLLPLSGYSRNSDNWPKTSRETLDQVLARSSSVYPVEPAIRSAHVLLKPSRIAAGSVSNAVVAGQLEAVPHQTTTTGLYAQLFDGFSAVHDPGAEARAAFRGRTIDRVRNQYERIRGHRRLSAADRRALEAHVEHLTALEARLGRQDVAAGCVQPVQRLDSDLHDEMNLPQATTDAIDLLVAAVKCDRTRVMTLMLSSHGDVRQSAYLPGGAVGDHHGIAHDAHYNVEKRPILGRINNWYGDRVAELLTKLNQVEDPETGATYLDNTLVYWGNEAGANQRDSHWTCNMPVLLAGGAGGHFRTGRYVDYRHVTGGVEGSEEGDKIAGLGDDDVFRGRLYNSLLLSILEAFGASPSEYEEPGVTGFGDYEENRNDQYSLEDGRRALPYLT